MTEADAEALLASLLSSDVTALRRQMPLGCKVVDIVVDWARDRNEPPEIETIEVKLRDWRGGAGQAYVSTLHVGRASVAMPANPRRRVDADYFEELGVGLIEFDTRGWRRVIQPRVRPRDETATQVLIRGECTRGSV